MTVPATTRKAGPYTGTGAVSNYPFSFKIFATTDVQVTVADTSGVETTLSSGFSVAMNADQSASPGGSITLSSPLTLDFKLTILGNLPYDQTLSLPGGGNFDPQVIGNNFDRTVMQVQQIAERDSRSVTNAATSSGVSNVLPGPVALMLLGWDALATKIINYAGIASAAVSTFMNATGFLTATTLAQARAAIGALGAADNIATATTATTTVASGAVGTTQTANDNSTKIATTAYADAAASQIIPITASVAANALTISLASIALDFRSATLTDGTKTRLATGALSITVPATSNLGMPLSTQANELVVLVANSGGTPVLCIANIAGGIDFSETGVISPTTIGAASSSATVIYSSAAVSANSAYRVVGRVDSVFTTGTGWSAPTLVQGFGGNAMHAMSSLGYGQTWTARAGATNGTTYYNTSGKPIQVQTYWRRGANSAGYVTQTTTVAGVAIDVNSRFFATTDDSFSSPCFTVPPGQSYSVSVDVAGSFVMNELR